ncbi:MAG: hypothetical protein ACTSVZ_05775, partial [Promethearchaeota archaeon]
GIHPITTSLDFKIYNTIQACTTSRRFYMHIDHHIIHHFRTLISETAKSSDSSENTEKTETTEISCFRNIFYQYRTVSLEHFPELEKHMVQLKQNGQMGDHPTFQYYMESRTFLKPENFHEAKFVIVLAYFKPHAKLNLEYQGKTLSTMVPSPYYDDLDENVLETMQRNFRLILKL